MMEPIKLTKSQGLTVCQLGSCFHLVMSCQHGVTGKIQQTPVCLFKASKSLSGGSENFLPRFLLNVYQKIEIMITQISVLSFFQNFCPKKNGKLKIKSLSILNGQINLS